MITASELRLLYAYLPDTGEWFLKKPSGLRKVKGRTTAYGYVQHVIGGKAYYAHRLAWLYMRGEWPSNDIDHINGVRNDNKFANLRAATRAENMQNQRKAQANSKSGFLGVKKSSYSERWEAHIRANGKQNYLGVFDTPEEAHSAYLAAKRELHPFAVGA